MVLLRSHRPGQEGDRRVASYSVGDGAGGKTSGDQSGQTDAGAVRHAASGFAGGDPGAVCRSRQGTVPYALGAGENRHGADGGETDEGIPMQGEITGHSSVLLRGESGSAGGAEGEAALSDLERAGGGRGI